MKHCKCNHDTQDQIPQQQRISWQSTEHQSTCTCTPPPLLVSPIQSRGCAAVLAIELHQGWGPGRGYVTQAIILLYIHRFTPHTYIRRGAFDYRSFAPAPAPRLSGVCSDLSMVILCPLTGIKTAPPPPPRHQFTSPRLRVAGGPGRTPYLILINADSQTRRLTPHPTPSSH